MISKALLGLLLIGGLGYVYISGTGEREEEILPPPGKKPSFGGAWFPSFRGAIPSLSPGTTVREYAATPGAVYNVTVEAPSSIIPSKKTVFTGQEISGYGTYEVSGLGYSGAIPSGSTSVSSDSTTKKAKAITYGETEVYGETYYKVN